MKTITLMLMMLAALSVYAQSNKTDTVSSSLTGGKDFPPELRKGLLLYWNFNEDSKVTDLNGNGHSGKITNATWNNDGAIGGAYEFKGKGFIATEKDLEQPDTGEMTVSVWIRPSVDYNKSTGLRTITSHSWGTHQLRYIKGGIEVELYDPQHKFYHYDYPTTLKAGQWYHIAFTAKSDGKMTLYVGGQQVLEGNVDYKLEVATKEFRIGNCVGNDRGFFVGSIDEVMIWDRELPPGHIKNIYKMRNGKDSPKE
jgi:hypothetical protein